MLKQVADGVLVHQSEFLQSNAVVVVGDAGVLIIDPGVQGHEMACLADDLDELGLTVVAGFSTHPHWDHLLWHERFGDVPRYSTATCAGTVRARLSDEGAKARVATVIPPDIVDQVPLDLLGIVTGLDADATVIPWAGPAVRIIEHQAHAPGHASLLIEEKRVLAAGDMVSDILMPFLDLSGTPDPVTDYLAALQLLEDVADGVHVVIPGHGSVGDAEDLRTRLTLDRAYVLSLRGGDVSVDPRIDAAPVGMEWLVGVHERQAQQVAAHD